MEAFFMFTTLFFMGWILLSTSAKQAAVSPHIRKTIALMADYDGWEIRENGRWMRHKSGLVLRVCEVREQVYFWDPVYVHCDAILKQDKEALMFAFHALGFTWQKSTSLERAAEDRRMKGLERESIERLQEALK